MHWATGPGRMSVCFDVTFSNFFLNNPVAHWAIVLRNTVALMATEVRGEGALFGNATGFTYPSTLNPTGMLETYMGLAPAAPSGNYTWPTSDLARSIGLHDNTPYRIIVEATKTIDNQRYIRYRVWKQMPTTLVWQPVGDSGDVTRLVRMYLSSKFSTPSVL